MLLINSKIENEFKLELISANLDKLLIKRISININQIKVSICK